MGRWPKIIRGLRNDTQVLVEASGLRSDRKRKTLLSKEEGRREDGSRCQCTDPGQEVEQGLIWRFPFALWSKSKAISFRETGTWIKAREEWRWLLGLRREGNMMGLIDSPNKANYHHIVVLKMKNLKFGKDIFLCFKVETLSPWLSTLYWNTCIKKIIQWCFVQQDRTCLASYSPKPHISAKNECSLLPKYLFSTTTRWCFVQLIQE